MTRSTLCYNVALSHIQTQPHQTCSFRLLINRFFKVIMISAIEVFSSKMQLISVNEFSNVSNLLTKDGLGQDCLYFGNNSYSITTFDSRFIPRPNHSQDNGNVSDRYHDRIRIPQVRRLHSRHRFILRLLLSTRRPVSGRLLRWSPLCTLHHAPSYQRQRLEVQVRISIPVAFVSFFLLTDMP